MDGHVARLASAGDTRHHMIRLHEGTAGVTVNGAHDCTWEAGETPEQVAAYWIADFSVARAGVELRQQSSLEDAGGDTERGKSCS